MGRVVYTGVHPPPSKGLPVETKDAGSGDYNLDSNKIYFVNTAASVSGLTLTLPLFPVEGDVIRIFDIANTFDTKNCIIARNGSQIMGAGDNLTINTQGAAFELVYTNLTYGWRLFTI